MNNDRAVIEAAETIVRDAVEGDPGQLLDAIEIPLQLVAEQLTQAAYAAQDALQRLYEIAAAYAAVQAGAREQVEALQLSTDPESPAGTRTTRVEGELLSLRGRIYAGHSPEEVLMGTLGYALNEFTDLGAGERLEVRVHRLGRGE